MKIKLWFPRCAHTAGSLETLVIFEDARLEADEEEVWITDRCGATLAFYEAHEITRIEVLLPTQSDPPAAPTAEARG